MVIFYSYVNVYQRVALMIWLMISPCYLLVLVLAQLWYTSVAEFPIDPPAIAGCIWPLVS